MSGRSPRRAALALAAALVVVATAMPAREAAARSDEPKRGFSGAVSLAEGFTDNLRASSIDAVDAWFAELSSRTTLQRRPRGWLPWRIGGAGRLRIYQNGYSKHDFVELGPHFGYDWDKLSLTVEYMYSPHRIRVDPGTFNSIPAYAQEHDLSAEFRSKFGKDKRWLALVTLGVQWELFDDKVFQGRNYHEEDIEAGIRYRATPRITPRASLAFRERDADSPNFDREEVALLFGIDVALPANMRGLLRYEKTWRNFLVGNPRDDLGARNSNYGREDDEDRFGAGLDIPVPRIDGFTVRIRYDHFDNNATRPGRSFKTNEANLALSYEFD